MPNITWSADPNDGKSVEAIYEETNVGSAKARITTISESEWQCKTNYLPARTQQVIISTLTQNPTVARTLPAEPTLTMAAERAEQDITAYMNTEREKAELAAASDQQVQKEIQAFLERQHIT